MKIEAAPFDDALKAWVEQQFDAYNTQHGFDATKELFCYTAHDDAGNLQGVARGYLQGGWLHLNDLVIEASTRKAGLGSRLMQQVEELAKHRQCKGITVNTLGIQAPGFYEKHGFTRFGLLEGFGVTEKYYFLKRL